jgi:hypothetical protein
MPWAPPSAIATVHYHTDQLQGLAVARGLTAIAVRRGAVALHLLGGAKAQSVLRPLCIYQMHSAFVVRHVRHKGLAAGQHYRLAQRRSA